MENSAKTQNVARKQRNVTGNNTWTMYRLYITDLADAERLRVDGSLRSILRQAADVVDAPSYDVARRELKNAGAFAGYVPFLPDTAQLALLRIVPLSLLANLVSKQ